MTTRQLAAMQAHDVPDVVLLDARTAAEFNVSHLPGAVLASNARMALDALEVNDPERTVVVYCSVGYRSSRLAKQLRARGFENVFNLEGSLFQWANEGRPALPWRQARTQGASIRRRVGPVARQAALGGLSCHSARRLVFQC